MRRASRELLRDAAEEVSVDFVCGKAFVFFFLGWGYCIDCNLIHSDVVEIIEDFVRSAEHRGIQVEVKKLYEDKLTLPIPHFKLKKLNFQKVYTGKNLYRSR